MGSFFASHKGWLSMALGVVAVAAAPKLGVTPEQFTADVAAIATIVSTYVASHNYQKAKASAAGSGS